MRFALVTRRGSRGGPGLTSSPHYSTCPEISMMVARGAAPSRSGLRPALRAPLTELPMTARRSRAVLPRCRCRERLQHTIERSTACPPSSASWEAARRHRRRPPSRTARSGRWRRGRVRPSTTGIDVHAHPRGGDTAPRDAWCAPRGRDEAVGVTRQLLPGSSRPLARRPGVGPSRAAKQLSTARPRPRELLQTATPHSIKRQVRRWRAERTTVTAGESRNGSDGTRTRDLRRDRPAL